MYLGMDRFHFFKRSFRNENDEEKTIVFNGNRFQNGRLKTTVFKS